MQVVLLLWCGAQAVVFLAGLLVALFDRREDPRFKGDKIIYRS